MEISVYTNSKHIARSLNSEQLKGQIYAQYVDSVCWRA